MNPVLGFAGALIGGTGLAMAILALEQRRVAAANGAADWLAVDMPPTPGAMRATASGSFLARVIRPVLTRLGGAVIGLAPSRHVDRVHERLLHAGLTGRWRAEEVVALNVLTAVGSVVLAVAWVTSVQPPARLALGGVGVLLAFGFCAPNAWLARAVQARHDAIFHDLPDALDLMVIGMEAGVTFDGALQVVSDHLRTPLGEELGRTLSEMELGLSRRDALQNLKRRVDLPDLTNIIVALLQADALGMSVAKVLRVQANEMRAKRRAWAREKAGKLPVKILFPLVAFIFPPVLIIILGPVAGDLHGMFGG